MVCQNTSFCIDNVTTIPSVTLLPFEVSDLERKIEVSVLGLIGVCGFLLNLVTLLSAWFCRKSLKVYHCLILNLSVTNFLLATLGCPFYMYGVAANGWFIGRGWCYVFSVVIAQGLPVSTCTNAAIALNRFLCCRPHSSVAKVIRGKTATLIIIAGIWFTVFVVAIVPQICGALVVDYIPAFGVCGVAVYNDLESLTAFIMCLYILVVCVPFLLTCVFYINVVISILSKSGVNPATQAHKKYNVKATKTTGTLFVIFSLCWLPDTLHNLIDVTSDMIPIWATRGLFMLFLANTAINPLLYMTNMKQFRVGVTKCLCRQNNAIAPFTVSNTVSAQVASNPH